MRLARRRLGAASPSEAPTSRWAAASAASSLSAAERKTMSPGSCPRSIASEPSLMLPGVAWRRCMAAGRLTGDGRADRSLVQAGLADEDEAGGEGFPGTPVAVVIVLQPLAADLHPQAHRLDRDGAEAVRSEERGVGKECVTTCRHRGAPPHK